MRTSTFFQLGRLRASRVAGAAICIICCLLAAAAPASAEGSTDRAQPRTISVSGTGSVAASPDMAVVRLGVETRSRDVGRAIEDAAARTTAVTKALEGDGVAAEDISTVDYNVSFVPTPEGRSGSTPAPGGGGPGHASGPAGYYRVSDVAAVTVRDLSKLGKILDDALTAGSNEVQGVSFRIADPAPLEMKARAMAFRDAHAKAEEIANLAGEKLGRVLQVGTAGAPIPLASANYRTALAAPPISPGALEVSVTLEVVYALDGR